MATQEAVTTTESAPAAPGAHLADPAPLGLASFATTTLVLSTFNAGLLPAALEAVVVPLALFYGGVIQVLVGIVEVRKGNTFGATVFASYGSFWLSFAFLAWLFLPELEKADKAGAAQAVGVFLLAWTIFTLYITIASFRTNAVFAVILVLLLLTFLSLTIGYLGGATGAITLGGYIGYVLVAVAYYGSAALLLNNMAGKTVLPMGARG